MTQSYFPITLPSRGKLYKDIDPSTIQIRAFTGGDEAILSEMTEKNAVEKLTEVLGRCLKGIDIKELTLGDKLYLLVWHAINSYTDGFKTKIVCETCLQEVSIEYKLADLETIYLPDNYHEPHLISLSDGKQIGCRLLRIKDEMQISTFEKGISNPYLYRIAIFVMDSTKDIVERVKWLEDLPAKDVAKLRAFQDSFYHGPNFEKKYCCPKCAGEGTFIVPFRFDHFYPYGNTLIKSFGVKV